MAKYDPNDGWDDEPPSNPPPHPLEYRRRDEPNEPRLTRVPYLLQVGIGIAAWALVLCASAAMFQHFAVPGVILTFPFAISAVFAYGTYLKSSRGWRGFGVGVMLGIGLSCLLPIVSILILCGGGGGGHSRF